MNNRDNIIKCIHMRIIVAFKVVAQYSFTLRIYNPVFPDTGVLVFGNFLYVITAAAGRRHNLNTEVRCAVDSFLHEPVELADYGNIRLDHRAVIAVELDIKWRWKDFTWAFIFANIKTDVH